MHTDAEQRKSISVRRMEGQALAISALFLSAFSILQACQESESAARMLLVSFCTVTALVWGWQVVPVMRRLAPLEQTTLVQLLLWLAFPIGLAVVSITLMSPHMGEALGIYLCCSGVGLFGLQLRDLVPTLGREWAWVSVVACVYAGFLLLFVFSEQILGYVFWRMVLRRIGSEM